MVALLPNDNCPTLFSSEVGGVGWGGLGVFPMGEMFDCDKDDILK
jgi:hypothetical protein